MSHAELPAAAVIQACTTYIEKREARIAREREDAIAAHVGHRGWFGFGRPTTREEAEAECADEVSWIEITGGMWYDRVVRLRSLATVAEKTNSSVMVDADIAHLLEPHFG